MIEPRRSWGLPSSMQSAPANKRSSEGRYTIDVVIPTRDTRDLTAGCVQSVLGAGEAGHLGVHCIVVDNASSDGTAVMIRERWPEADVVSNSWDVGYGGACNQGARVGSGKFILVLNSDIVVRPTAIERLASFLECNTSYTAAGGQLVDLGTNRTQVGFTLRDFPRLWTQLALLVGLERVWPTNPVSRRQLMLDFDYDRTQEVDAQPAGACLMCRRVDFEAVGGFDEEFFYWFEDVDLVRRLRSRGRIAYVHDAVFEHLGAGTFRQWPRSDVVVNRYRSLLRYFRKHQPRSEVIALRIVVSALAAMRALGSLPFDAQRSRAYATVFALAAKGG